MALTAQGGGVGMAPGVDIGDPLAVFGATHGTAVKYTNQDGIHPGFLIPDRKSLTKALFHFK